MIKPIILIPHYCHSNTLPQVLNKLHSLQLPILIVDDGSTPEHQQKLHTLSNHNTQIIFKLTNQGKGSACKHGIQIAHQQGYTHLLQIDADAQHNFNDIPTFIKQAQQHPHALICGNPIYQQDAPKIRLYGRKITNFWNIIHTWSTNIKDGMCGFRLYPIAPTINILNHRYIGNRMDFDNEILIHLYWQNTPLIWIDTKVQYPKEGISHFLPFKDNLRISLMHSRLFCQMPYYQLKRHLKKTS